MLLAKTILLRCNVAYRCNEKWPIDTFLQTSICVLFMLVRMIPAYSREQRADDTPMTDSSTWIPAQPQFKEPHALTDILIVK
jgi:hypothetical protein